MRDCEEDRIFRFSFAVIIITIAENEAKGVGCLVPSASSLHRIWFLGSRKITQTRLFQWIGKICRSQAISKKFGKGAASGSATRVRDIVVDVGFAIGEKEEEPVLFDL